MTPPSKPKRWNATLRRIVSVVDSLPTWVMMLVALTCLFLAIWLLTDAHGLGLGQPAGTSHPLWTFSRLTKDPINGR